MIKESLHNLKTWLLVASIFQLIWEKLSFELKEWKMLVNQRFLFLKMWYIHMIEYYWLSKKKKKGNLDICGNMDEPGGHYSKGKLPRNATWFHSHVEPKIVVQSLSCVHFLVTPGTAAHQASLSFTISWCLLKLMSLSRW